MVVEDRSAQVYAVAILFFVLSWITVGLRTYVRACIIRSVGTDDKLMILLLVSSSNPDSTAINLTLF
jgi:hypothetical protein